MRKATSAEDTIQGFVPALSTQAQAKVLKTALQMLGDLTGSGIGYSDFDGAGYVKTATEVSSDNSALMRNIRRHEHALEGAIAGICRAVMAASRSLGTEELPEEGEARVTFDDSIITDTGAEKQQDMAEVATGLMEAWEYRVKWCGEDEATARSASGRAPERVPPTARGGGRWWVASAIALLVLIDRRSGPGAHSSCQRPSSRLPQLPKPPCRAAGPQATAEKRNASPRRTAPGRRTSTASRGRRT